MDILFTHSTASKLNSLSIYIYLYICLASSIMGRYRVKFYVNISCILLLLYSRWICDFPFVFPFYSFGVIMLYPVYTAFVIKQLLFEVVASGIIYKKLHGPKI